MIHRIFAILFIWGLFLSGCGNSATPASVQAFDIPCDVAELVSVLEGINANPPAGDSVINLAPNCEYVFTDPAAGDDGITALPTIHTSVVINGNQAVLKLLKQIEDPPLRLLKINLNGILLLNDLTLRTENTSPYNPKRDVSELGGAIYSQGQLGLDSVSMLDNFAAQGGAIYSTGILTVDNSIFEGNKADDGGGAIYSEGTLQLSNSSFINNRSKFTSYGGAVFKYAGDLNIDYCEFRSNSAIGTHAHGGGAIGQIEGVLRVSDSVFDSNQYNGIAMRPQGNRPYNAGGGAIYLMGVDFSVSRSEFTNNESSHLGGAISTTGEEWTYHLSSDSLQVILGDPSDGKYPDTNAVIDSCRFSNNLAGQNSGAIHNQLGPMTIIRSEFEGNLSDLDVGVISHGGGLLSIRYSTFRDYHSQGIWPLVQGIGGGRIEIYKSLFANNDFPVSTISTIWSTGLSIGNSTISSNSGPIVAHGSLEIISSTIAQNSSVGVIFEPTLGSPEMMVMNSIIAGNAGGDCELHDSITAVGDNLDSDGSCSGFSLTADPLLGPLADNGGQTLTLALDASSPAISAGALNCPADDQRDVARPAANCDLGAYEETSVIISKATFVPEWVDRCQLFDPSVITITLMTIPPGTTRQTLYLKIPGGVPGLERDIPEDGDPWVYTARLGETAAESCTFEGYQERLYCTFILPENAMGAALELIAEVNHCDQPIFTHPSVSIFKPEPTLACSKDLDESACIEAGGIYKDDSMMVAPFCDCP